MKTIKIESISQIPFEYKNTPIEQLIKYHNKLSVFNEHDKADIIVGMCMDYRKNLNIPKNFAYVVRTGGANIKGSEFYLSYVIAIANIKHIVLLAHDYCGMVDLDANKEDFINGMCKNAGWNKEQARKHFEDNIDKAEIVNEIDFVLSEAKRISDMYPNVMVAPLFYSLADDMLHVISK